ncbi:MAG: PAS domain-containing protein [Alphaproteobacteria bacterium]|nr:PAS domain-containing protein [Alphaproteobacteria bacterium]
MWRRGVNAKDPQDSTGGCFRPWALILVPLVIFAARWNFPRARQFEPKAECTEGTMYDPDSETSRLLAPDSIVEQAVALLEPGDASLFATLEDLPAPIYVTDARGLVVYFNSACIQFAGRTPIAGKDRWCVTWKLYTDNGEFLPHDRCPMAEAIVKKQPIRNVTAVAERPDGTRVNFMPYPTPLFDRDGELRGAVNVLIDVTDQRQATLLRAQASKCARLSGATGDNDVTATLNRLAHEYEAKALALESRARQRDLAARTDRSKMQA